MKTIVRLSIICCLLMGLLSLPTPASAQLPTYFYREVVYSGADFRPINSSLHYYTGFNNAYPYTLENNAAVFTMPLILPREADVEAVTFYFMDNSVDGDLRFEMTMYDPDANTSRTIFFNETDTVEPSNQIRWKQTVLPTPESIDDSCAYQLRVIFDKADSKEMFYGARVNYRVPVIVNPLNTDTTFTVAGMNFYPGQSEMQYAPVGYGVSLLQEAPSNSSYFFFPLDLPMGGEVKEVVFYYIDNSTSNLVVIVDGIKPAVHLSSGYATYNTIGETPEDKIHSKSMDVSGIPTHNGQSRYRLVYNPTSAGSTMVLVAARVRYSGSDSGRGVKVKTISGSELRPTTHSVGFTTPIGGLQPSGANWSKYYYANLKLPDYRTISKITFFYKDNHAEDNVKATVMKYEPPTDNNIWTYPFEWDSGSQGAPSPDLRQMGGTPSVGVLNTDVYSYYTWVTFDGDDELLLYGLQIEYFSPYQTYLPTLSR